MVHLQQRRDTCGREWEKGYWKDTVDRWSDWDKELQVGLVMKWIELYWKKKLDCEICWKGYKEVASMKRHIMKEETCMKEVMKIVIKFPIGYEDDDGWLYVG